MAGNAPRESAPQRYSFEQMNLQVGTRLQFITHRTLRPIQHFSTVIGWVKDEYLIVRIPLEQGVPIALDQGEKVTLRTFSGVNVCSFSSVVERVFGRPLFYVHVAFPTEIQGTSLRMAMRVKVDLPTRIRGAAGIEQPGHLVNVSVSGALMHTERPLAEEAGPVDVQFTLQTGPDKRQVMISAKALVRNVSAVTPPAEDARLHAYGVQFVDLDPTHYMVLQNLTYQALIEDRQKIV